MDDVPVRRTSGGDRFHQRVRTALAFAKFVLWLVMWLTFDD